MPDLLSCACVASLPPWKQLPDIIAASRVAAGLSPNKECYEGRPISAQLAAWYCAITATCETPELLSAEINGDSLELIFSTNVTGGEGFTGMVDGSPAVFTYVSGSGTDTLLLQSDVSADEGVMVTLDYTPGDVINGNCPLAAFTEFPVTNNTGVTFSYLRPGGADTYLRPGGVDTYIRP